MPDEWGELVDDRDGVGTSGNRALGVALVESVHELVGRFDHVGLGLSCGRQYRHRGEGNDA
jgi:hypothetical protein